MRMGSLRVPNALTNAYYYYLSDPHSGEPLIWGPELGDIDVSMPLAYMRESGLTLVLLGTGAVAFIESQLYDHYTDGL